MRSVRVIGVIGATLVATGQSPDPRPAFEVASVRVSRDATGSASIGPAPGGERFQAKHFPLYWLIATAYNVSIRQVSGLEMSVARREYDIEAKTARPVGRAEMLLMLRTLLEDRFNLRLRRETRELTVYVLVAGKGGPKLEENTDGADLEVGRISGSKTAYRNFTMPLFASILTGPLEDIVVDKTGLTGSYDFALDYLPVRIGQGVKEGREPAPDPGAPDLFTAVQEQLGLKLERQKTPVGFLVVDHVEQPSDN